MTCMKDDRLTKEFQYLEDNFNEALISNNVEGISSFLSVDWILLLPEFGIITKEQFLHAIKSDELSHISMQKEVSWVL